MNKNHTDKPYLPVKNNKRIYSLKRFFLLCILIIVSVLFPLLTSGLEARTVKLKPIKDPQTENAVINLYKRAQLLYKSDKKVDARLLLLQAARFDRTAMSPYIHELLSRIYHDLGNPNQAAAEAKLSLKYNPNQEGLLYNLGIYLNEADRHDEAISYLEMYKQKVKGEKKNNADSLINLLQEEKVKATKYSNHSSDYLDKLTAEDNVNRWPKEKIPLKVHIQPTSQATGFLPIFPQLAKDSFIAWFKASNRKVAFVFVDSQKEADINLEWTDKRLRTDNDKRERMKAGLTTSTTTVAGEIKKARIQVRTLNPFTKKGTAQDEIKETCLHEIGHSLGLNGHSTNQSDIMYMGTTRRQLPALARRDKATIAKLYKAYKEKAMAGVAPKQEKAVASIPSPAPIQTNSQNAGTIENSQSLTRQNPGIIQNNTNLSNMTPPQAMQTQAGGQYLAVPQAAYGNPGFNGNTNSLSPYQNAVPNGYPQSPYPQPGYYVQPSYPQQAYNPGYYPAPMQQANSQYYQQPYMPYPQGPQYTQQEIPPQSAYGYSPPAIPQQVASPYPVNPNQSFGTASLAPQMQYQGTSDQTNQVNPLPQPLQMIDNIFQNLKPKLQQFMNDPGVVGQPYQQQPQQY